MFTIGLTKRGSIHTDYSDKLQHVQPLKDNRCDRAQISKQGYQAGASEAASRINKDYVTPKTCTFLTRATTTQRLRAPSVKRLFKKPTCKPQTKIESGVSTEEKRCAGDRARKANKPKGNNRKSRTYGTPPFLLTEHRTDENRNYACNQIRF